MIFRVLITSLVLHASLDSTNAQQLAFPTAEGFGRFTVGGRGGDVYHVTTLADGPNIEGSLRLGLKNVPTGGRTIVFDVGGRIDLASRLPVQGTNITIAGQTAPGPGITLSGYNLLIGNTENIILRHLRLRPGDLNGSQGTAAATGDALSITDSQNIIVDHISASWSMDETIQAFGPEIDNITIQSSFITESLNDSFHPKGPHGYGAQLTRQADGGISFVRNLLAHHVLRSPRAGGLEGEEGLRLDFVNNVIYNWGQRAGHNSPTTPEFPEGMFNNLRMNYIGNYLVAGANTDPTTVDQVWYGTSSATRIFQEDNLIDSDLNGQLNPVAVDWENFDGLYVQATERFDFPQVTTDAPEDSLLRVMAESGATMGLTSDGTSVSTRDSIDARVVADFWNQTGAIIDSQADVGGWEDIPMVTRPAEYDLDLDGMADSWELLFGFDPTDADDRNFDPDGDGYTNLEEFLNFTLPVSTADFDFDGDVDANDLTTWQNAFGNSSAGDTDGDLDSDGADLLAWQRQFTGNLNPLGKSSTIPEPSTVILLFVGLILCVNGRIVLCQYSSLSHRPQGVKADVTVKA